MRNFKAIAAVAENGVIGRGLEIPWRIPEDFRHFKRTTMGGVLLMGRRTWESLGAKPLPRRENAVLTSRPELVKGARAFASLEEAASAYRGDPRTVWICGGAALYKAALPECSELILSRVKMSPQGDVYFPDFADLFEKKEIILENELFDVIRYIRK